MDAGSTTPGTTAIAPPRLGTNSAIAGSIAGSSVEASWTATASATEATPRPPPLQPLAPPTPGGATPTPPPGRTATAMDTTRAGKTPATATASIRFGRHGIARATMTTIDSTGPGMSTNDSIEKRSTRGTTGATVNDARHL